MQIPNRGAVVAAVCTLALGGCSFVEVEPDAEDVIVLGEERTRDCDRLGQTRVSVADSIGFIKRGDPKIREDLENLARNSAAEMGGDTITAETEIENGKQTYGIFDCVE